MIRLKFYLFVSLVFLLGAVFCGDVVFGQAKPASAGGGSGKGSSQQVLRIKSLGNSAVKTPEYSTTVQRGKGIAKEWQQIEVIYDTAPEWIDNLVFQYYVMAGTKGADGEPAFSLYKNSVRYVDIEKGNDHKSTVFLNPNAIKRYGTVVAVAVEIVYNGTVVEDKSKETIKLRDKWWKDPSVVENKNVTVRDGYLLDRAHTPFAFVNIDDNEVIQ